MLLRKTLFATLALAPLPAMSQPNAGSLVGKVDGDPMYYECLATQDSNKINCDFVQVLLSNKEKPEDLEAALSTIPEILADEAGEMEELCGATLPQLSGILALLERGESIDPDTPVPADPADVEYMRTSVVALQNLCQDRTAENAEALLRLTHERAAKTCTAFINKYSQSFVKVSEELWVVESAPAGPCGIIQTSRFVVPKEGAGFLWEYIAQKVVTNKTGTTEMGVQCSDLDEREVLYSWRGGPQRIDCTYID